MHPSLSLSPPNPAVSPKSAIEETLERIKNHKGVEGYVIVDHDANVLRNYPGMDSTVAMDWAQCIDKIGMLAQHCVRDLDAQVCLNHQQTLCLE